MNKSFRFFKPFNRQVIVSLLTFVALVMLTVIQISWLVKAAHLEMEAFNHRVSMAMSEVRDEIGKRASGCNMMQNYLCGRGCPMAERQNKISEIDSIIRANLVQHQINLDYKFLIGDTLVRQKQSKLFGADCYLQTLNGLIEKDNIRIQLQFPDRSQFIIAQMKGWFILSILVILFVAFSFYNTLRLFLKEQAMSTHQTDFVNNMVHEFQTPLANIKLATNLIRKKGSDLVDDKLQEYTGVILHENEKIEQHVNDILSLSYHNETTESLIKVDLHEIIHHQSKIFSYKIEESGGQINLSLNATQSIVFCDEKQMNLIISNLLDNAIKYSPIKPAISISTKSKKNSVEVCVRDNGIGISKANQSFIFDKYYRVSTGNTHNVKGFGLGLAYVKKMIDFHNGQISIVSEIDKGTEIKIVLPINFTDKTV